MQTIDGVAVRSVSDSQDEILEWIRALHCPSGFEADITFGNGAFWRNTQRPPLCFDLTPQVAGVTQADSRLLPISNECLGNVVFDPPFMTYIKNGREHKDGKVALSARYGGYYTYAELEDHYQETISEVWRVLRPKGKLVFKCQDIIHNHKMHSTHTKVIQMAESEGFKLTDLFVLLAKSRMPGPQKGTQKHARIWHSYFLVFEKPSRRINRE